MCVSVQSAVLYDVLLRPGECPVWASSTVDLVLNRRPKSKNVN